jgi:hypothetical protein
MVSQLDHGPRVLSVLWMYLPVGTATALATLGIPILARPSLTGTV